jgi:hypothetical protein
VVGAFDFTQSDHRDRDFHQLVHPFVPARIFLADLVIGTRERSPGPCEVVHPGLFCLLWVLRDRPVFRAQSGAERCEDHPDGCRRYRTSHREVLGKVVVDALRDSGTRRAPANSEPETKLANPEYLASDRAIESSSLRRNF